VVAIETNLGGKKFRDMEVVTTDEPPKKRRKFTDLECENLSPQETESLRKQLTAVLSDEELRDCDLVEMVAAQIPVPKHATEVLSYLNEHFPLSPDFTHLKRINRDRNGTLTVLMWPRQNSSENYTSDNNKNEKLQYLVEKYNLRLTNVNVPRWRPMTPLQMKKALTFWRLNSQVTSTYLKPNDKVTNSGSFSVLSKLLVSTQIHTTA
jgi:hypothetical protein